MLAGFDMAAYVLGFTVGAFSERLALVSGVIAFLVGSSGLQLIW
ncbi:hypothetical protein [Novosphingobium sp. 9U]|nr:hypothetical protein [Novosphingobium sp. 9U]VWX49772.1 hypothetical protein NOVOSPHI9U_260033 [Novosphingobium sp. 9U]